MHLKQKIFTVGSGASFIAEVAKYATHEAADIIVVPSAKDVDNILCEISKYTNKILNFTIFPFSDFAHCTCTRCKSFSLDSRAKFLLCAQFIEEYNKKHNTKYSSDLNGELVLLLDEIFSNGIDIRALQYLDIGFTESWQSKFLANFSEWWAKKVSEGKVTECRHVLELVNRLRGKRVISAGILFNKLFSGFLHKVLHEDIAKDCSIILPYINLDLPEDQWISLEKEHHQYWAVRLLRELKISRFDIQYLGDNAGSNAIDLLFNFKLPDSRCDFGVDRISNIELAVFRSEDEEAAHVLGILKSYGLSDNIELDGKGLGISGNDSLFMGTDSIVNRVNALMLVEDGAKGHVDHFYLACTLIMGVLDSVLSQGDVVNILSMLKHPLVTLGYPAEEYKSLVNIFEVQLIRKHSVTGFAAISDAVEVHVPQLRDFWSAINKAISPLIDIKEITSIGHIAGAHTCAIGDLIKGQSLGAEGRKKTIEVIDEFFNIFKKYCMNTQLFSLHMYKALWVFFIRFCSGSTRNRVSLQSFVKREVVILSGFNEGEYLNSMYSPLLNNLIRSKLGLPYIEEYSGYFLYALRDFFYAKKLFISRSTNVCGSITTEPVLVRYLSFLLAVFAKEHCVSSTFIEDSSCENYGTEFGIRLPNSSLDQRRRAMSLLTADSVDMLVNNPYAFYLKHIVDIRPMRPINTGFVSRNFSILVHRVLRKYLEHVDLQSDYGILANIAKEEVDLMSKDQPYIKEIWCPRLERIMQEFFVIDQNRKKEITLIKGRNQDFFWNVGEHIRVVAKCDRVEYSHDGKVSIVSYKVGSMPSQIDTQYGFATKEVVEAICVSEKVDPKSITFSYWKLTPRGVEVTEIKDFSCVVTRARSGLTTFLEGCLEGTIPFVPSRNPTKFIEYDLISRTSNKG